MSINLRRRERDHAQLFPCHSGNIPHICGGFKNLHCYRYMPTNDTWVVSGTLMYAHGSHLLQMTGFTYHDDLGLVITGGLWGTNGTTKVESTVDGQTFQELRDLLGKNWGQCLVTLEDGNLLSCGGYRNRGTRRYKVQDDRWDNLGSRMKSDHQNRVCGKVINCTTGKEEVVVAGGQDKNWKKHSATEIYSVEDGSWRVGTPLPEANAHMASIPYEDSFLVLGGDADYCSNKIYKV